MLTEEKQAQIERCEPVAVPTLLNLACCAVLVHRTTLHPPSPYPCLSRYSCIGVGRDNRNQIQQLPQDLQEYDPHAHDAHTRGGTVLRRVAVFRYLRDTYRCWRCRRKCTGRPAVVVIRRVNLAPRQKQNRRAAGYWGGEPTYALLLAQSRTAPSLTALTHTRHSATPCLFTFDRLGCYNAWHDADDPDVVKGVRKEAVLDPAAFT